jgi:hypothetical protein
MFEKRNVLVTFLSQIMGGASKDGALLVAEISNRKIFESFAQALSRCIYPEMWTKGRRRR